MIEKFTIIDGYVDLLDSELSLVTNGKDKYGIASLDILSYSLPPEPALTVYKYNRISLIPRSIEKVNKK